MTLSPDRTATDTLSVPVRPTDARLAVLPLLQALREHAAEPDLDQLVDVHATERRWLELASTPDLQVWLISWPPGATTGWHDHGEAHGAFTTIRGRLTEEAWEPGRTGSVTAGPVRRTLGRGDARAFNDRHVHNVTNTGRVPAVSVHAYSPRLTTMTRYDVSTGRLEVTGVERTGADW